MVMKILLTSCIVCGKQFNKAYKPNKKTCSDKCTLWLRRITQAQCRIAKYDNCKKNNLCYECGKKAKAIKCPHCKEVIFYHSRCEKCRDKEIMKRALLADLGGKDGM